MRSLSSTWASACGWNICRTPDSSSSTRPSSEWPSPSGCPLLGGELGGLEELAGVRSVYIAGSVIRYGASIAASSAATCRHSARAWSSASPPRCRAVPAVAPVSVRPRRPSSSRSCSGFGGQVAEGARARRRCSRPRRPRRGTGARAPASGRRGTRRPRSRGRCRAAGSAGRAWSGELLRVAVRPSPRGGRLRGAGMSRSGVGCVERAGRRLADPTRGAQRVLFAAKPAILSMLVASTNDGPVSDRLAAADVVAVGQLQPQRVDGLVALQVGLLVDGELDFSVLDAPARPRG